MDRRQRKTRESIFKAFTELLSQKKFEQITVGEIIESADVGRATFYAHFETKDFLLKELCGELFCHLFDGMSQEENGHRHIFECDGSGFVFLHLFRHLYNNDNNILRLLSGENNELFMGYFKSNLRVLAESQLDLYDEEKRNALPADFLINHMVSAFVETVRWWAAGGVKESPETITEYFCSVL